jgi:hypothetical protein
MGYMIHFDDDSVDTDELKLIETKKAILEKLRVRFGFEYASSPHALTGQSVTANGSPRTHAVQPR